MITPATKIVIFCASLLFAAAVSVLMLFPGLSVSTLGATLHRADVMVDIALREYRASGAARR